MSETKKFAALYSKQGFPSITEHNLTITSPCTVKYNCIAWAASEDIRWWWPDPMGSYYWPPNVQRAEAIDAFIEAYGTLGYEVCADGNPEEGFEKIMIYLKDNKPTHAARLIDGELWTSKLGQAHDISHGHDLLNGPIYGKPAIYMKRRI